MDNITRRELFSKLCSKDTLKDILGAWYSFNNEAKKEEKKLSCEEAGMMLGRKATRRLEFLKNSSKERRDKG